MSLELPVFTEFKLAVTWVPLPQILEQSMLLCFIYLFGPRYDQDFFFWTSIRPGFFILVLFSGYLLICNFSASPGPSRPLARLPVFMGAIFLCPITKKGLGTFTAFSYLQPAACNHGSNAILLTEVYFPSLQKPLFCAPYLKKYVQSYNYCILSARREDSI